MLLVATGDSMQLGGGQVRWPALRRPLRGQHLLGKEIER